VTCEAPPLASSGSLVARVFNQLRHCIRLVAPSRQDPQSKAVGIMQPETEGIVQITFVTLLHLLEA
jgi:hypothetical protein